MTISVPAHTDLSVDNVSLEKSSSTQDDSVLLTVTIPTSLHLYVPFTSQAPFGDWGDPYQEACEEASLIMARYYLDALPLDRSTADSEIHKLVQWEERHEYTQDVTIEELQEIAQKYYGISTRVEDTISLQAIQYELSLGNIVILPLAGQDIGNPYFSGDGPPYHMLVVTGYTQTELITNDPGTKRGKDYRYDNNVLLSAIHDWTGDVSTIRSGKKRMLVIEKTR